MFTTVSIPKSSKVGAPRGKDPNVIIFDMADVLQQDREYTGWPTTDANGVKSTSNLLLKDGAKAISVYMTPTTINRFNQSEGDPDKAGWIQNFVGEHPDEELQFSEFLKNNINANFGIISLECGDGLGTRLIGRPCAPLGLQATGQDNNDGVMSTLTFASKNKSQHVMIHYVGDLPDIADYYDSDQGSGSGGGGL